MNRSPMSAAAISWVITCGLLCGGAGMVAATPAAADPGTVGSSHGGRGAGGSDSDDVRGPRRPGTPRGGEVTPGTARPGGGMAGGAHPPVTGDGEIPDDCDDPGRPDWPDRGWPFPLFPILQWPPRAELGDGVGVVRPPRLHIAPPPPVAGGSNGGGIGIPPRTMPPPGEPGNPGEPPVVSADRGTVGPAGVEPPPITMPPVIGMPPLLEAPLRPVGPASEPVPRGGPGRESSTTRERLPATSAGAGTELPPSTRVGYPEYLRDAKIGEVAVLALPGFAGLLALTAFGGFLGYRQAKAGHVVRAAGTTRFMQ